MPNYTGGVWRTIRGTHVFIRDGEDLETAFKRVKQKGYSDNDFRKQEEKIAQLNKEYNALLDEEIDLQKDWNQWEEPGYELESAAYDRSQKEEELSEARKKYEEMSKSPYVERKLKMGRENYDKLMGKTNDKEIDKLNKEYEDRQQKIKSMNVNDKNYDTEKNHLESQQRDLVEKINKLENDNKMFGADINPMEEWSDTTGIGLSDLQMSNLNITEAPTTASQYTMLKSTPYKKGLDRKIDMNLSSTSNSAGKDAEILNSVIGQLSDGIWENSPGMDRYWTNMDFTDNEGKIMMNVPKSYYNWEGNSYGRPANNPFYEKTDEQVRNYIAEKAKQVVKTNINDDISLGKWSRDNNNVVDYMGGHNADKVTVADVYSFYDRVKGRSGKSYNTYGKDTFTSQELDTIKSKVDRFKERKGNEKPSSNYFDANSKSYLPNMTDSEVRKIARQYGIETNGKSKDNLIGALLKMFNK